MSLQGLLETFALPDVLRLLASTNKTGELQVKTRRVEGLVWVKDGWLVGGAVGEIETTVDVVFELLRSTEGSFSFILDRPSARPSEPLGVDAVLHDVEARLAEWREIEAVIPSLHAKLFLAKSIDGDVMFNAEEWAVIAVIGSGSTVSQVMKALGTSEFVTCKRLKYLVEMRVLVVGSADDGDGLFEEPETDVSFLSPGIEAKPSKKKEAVGADAKQANESSESPKGVDEDAEAVARWEEIRRLAKIDEETDGEELTAEEQKRAKELIKAQGEKAPDGEQINRGDLLKLLASAQTSA